MTREEQDIRDAMRRSGRNAAILTGVVVALALLYFAAIYILGKM